MNCVIDTNVLVAANGRETHADPACRAACARTLLDVLDNHVLLEDTADLVFTEYRQYCNFAGQPGVGDRFFRWLHLNRRTSTRVTRVNVGTSGADLLAILPPTLHAFDASDHKWLAVYLRGNGDIAYNAMDSDWYHHANELRDAGIRVEELCPQHVPRDG